MKKFERIVLHIGLHKTGTTTLQDFLYQYRLPLEQELQVLYPALHRNYSQALYSAFAEQPEQYSVNIRNGLDTPAKVALVNEENLQALLKECAASTATQLILSGEDLSLLSSAGLQRLRDWLSPLAEEMCVVCALRDPLKWSVSAAQSRIRGGHSYAEVNLEPPLQRARQRLQRCAQVFGETGIKLIDFDAALQGEGGLPGAFFDVLGLPRSWVSGKPVQRRNESMSLEAAYLISSLNQDLPLYVDGKLGQRRFKDDIREMIQQTAGRPFALTATAMQKIKDCSEPESAWLEDKFAITLDNSRLSTPVERAAGTLNFSPAAISSIAGQLHDKARVRKNNALLTNRVQALQEQLQQTRTELATSRLDIDKARAELHARGVETDRARAELEEIQARLTAIENSRSWKLTGPLRRLKTLLSGFS